MGLVSGMTECPSQLTNVILAFGPGSLGRKGARATRRGLSADRQNSLRLPQTVDGIIGMSRTLSRSVRCAFREWHQQFSSTLTGPADRVAMAGPSGPNLEVPAERAFAPKHH